MQDDGAGRWLAGAVPMVPEAGRTHPSAAVTVEAAGAVLERIRVRTPRVHCSMNSVAQPFVANVLSALGADVSMTSSQAEIAPLVMGADALLVNLGTLDPTRRAGIDTAVAAAQARGTPWVLDPVKVDRVPARLDYALALLARQPSIIKANHDEAGALFFGIAAGDRGPVCVETGDRDRIVDGGKVLLAHNGTPLLARVSATGCACGAVIAAARAVEPDPLLAAIAGLTIWNIAAEMAAEGDPGPGSFVMRLVDAVYRIDAADIRARARWSDA